MNNYHPQAVIYFNQAMQLHTVDPQTSLRLLSGATQINEHFYEAWRELGNLLSEVGLVDASYACYRRALEFCSTDISSLVNLGYRLFNAGKLAEAKSLLLQSIKVDPQTVFGHTNLSLIYSIEGLHTKAIYHASLARRYAVEQINIQKDVLNAISFTQDSLFDEPMYTTTIKEEDLAKVEVALAFAYLHSGQYKEGLKWFEARIPYKYPHYLRYPYPRWDGKASLKGKHLILESDGGIGDTISYYRFLFDKRLLEAEKITFIVPPTLVRLTQIILKDHKNFSIQSLPNTFPIGDIWVPMLSLPVILDWSEEQLQKSRFHALPHTLISWKEQDSSWVRPNKLLHVGVSWAGNKENDIDKLRSFNVVDLLPLTTCPGVQLYNLQIGERSTELYASGAITTIIDLAPRINDVLDTIRHLTQLDLVVCCESALGHICGLIDKPCIIPYSYGGRDWRIGNGDKPNIWYPQHKVVRQDQRKTWEPVFKIITDMINAQTAHRRPRNE